MAEKTTYAVVEQLKVQVINLIDDLLEICPDEKDILFVRLYFDCNIDQYKLMDGFERWVYPWKKEIKIKDERFFKENDHIFGPLPTEKVSYFKTKFEDGTFEAEDKEMIWKYFQIYIKLIKKYRKLNKKIS